MKYSCLLILFFSFHIGFSQSTALEFKGKSLTTDPNGNYYEIYSNQLIKYSKLGQRLFVYSNSMLGEIASVDASNPLKVLVFFKDFSKVIFLDNALSEWVKDATINELSIEETSLVCSSYNSGIWYYNPVKFQLTRIENNSMTNTSPNISNLININIQPNFMVEYNNRLYLNDPKNGILVFDSYGAYLKTIPIFNLNSFQVKEKYLIYVNQDNLIESYDFLSLEKSIYSSEQFNNCQSVRIENNIMYILFKDGILAVNVLR